MERTERGKRAMFQQMYKITKEIAGLDRVALEDRWVGLSTVPIRSIPEEGQMRAFFALFLEFREVELIRQRNYDCYEPW
jgi:hypothetical protein